MPKSQPQEMPEFRRSFIRLSTNPPLSTWRIIGPAIESSDADDQANTLVQILRARGDNCHWVANIHDQSKTYPSILVVIQHDAPQPKRLK